MLRLFTQLVKEKDEHHVLSCALPALLGWEELRSSAANIADQTLFVQSGACGHEGSQWLRCRQYSIIDTRILRDFRAHKLMTFLCPIPFPCTCYSPIPRLFIRRCSTPPSAFETVSGGKRIPSEHHVKGVPLFSVSGWIGALKMRSEQCVLFFLKMVSVPEGNLKRPGCICGCICRVKRGIGIKNAGERSIIIGPSRPAEC